MNYRTLETRLLNAQEQSEVDFARRQFEELSRNDENQDYKFTNARIKFAKMLQKEYNNTVDYLMFHILIGSTPRTPRKQLDFQGEHSVREFFTHPYSHEPTETPFS